jgi:hypothetical protein
LVLSSSRAPIRAISDIQGVLIRPVSAGRTRTHDDDAIAARRERLDAA